MSLQDDVANFLLSDERYITLGLSRLNFSLDGCRVDTEGYREIGNMIRIGSISVRAARTSGGSSVAAVYTPALDRISVPGHLDLRTRGTALIGNQAMIVHESTHALLDFHRYSVLGSVDEACAYIAGQTYAAALSYRLSSGNPSSQAILAASQAIVDRRQMTAQVGAVLQPTDADVAALLGAIASHASAYPDANAVHRGDGIRIGEGLINPWYQPRE